MSLKEDRVNLIVTINGDQGRRELGQLDQKAFDLRNKMKDLKKGTEEYVNAGKDLKLVTDKMDDLKKSMGITSLTTRELNQELKRLSAVRSYLTPGTEAFKANSDAIVTVKKRLFELNQEVKVGEGFWSKMKTSLAQFGVGALAFVGFQQIVGKIQNLFTANAKLSDSLANVQKTTGLSEEAVNRLNSALKNIDTRTSREELLKLAAEAGKLGKDSVADVQKFVKQADIIKVALGEDLGDDAVIQIAKLSNIFRTEMLNIASAVNSIGQASAASEQFQVDFLSRISGVAQTAKLSAPDLLGYGAALEINGQTAEKSGTALTNFFIDFVKNSENFGKAAGFAKGELTKLLSEKGTNDAFIEFLKRLKEGSGSSQELLVKLEQLGIDGSRGANVFLALANNIGTVVAQQNLANTSFNEGTSVIKEFNVRNENFAAVLEKTQKKIAAWFSGGSLMAGLKDFVQGIYDFMDTTSEVDKSADAWEKSVQAVKSYDSVIPGLLERYDQLKSKSVLTKDEQTELKSIIEKISQFIPTAISSFDEYGEALDINAGKARSYGDALRQMMEIKNADALKEGRAAISDLRLEIEGLQNTLSNRDESGDLFKKVKVGNQGGMFSAGSTHFENIKLTAKEILELQQKLEESQGKLSGYEALVNDLAGVKIYADKAGDAISKINTPNPDGPVVPTKTTLTAEEIEALRKKAEVLSKELDGYLKKVQEINSEFNKSGLNKDERALQDIRERYQPLIDQAKSHDVASDPQFLQYRAERIKLEGLLQQELERKREEFRQRDLAAKQKSEDEIFNALQNKSDKEINDEADKWDRLITMASQAGIDETDLIIAKGNAISLIRKKQKADEIKDTKDKNQKVLDEDRKRIAEEKQLLNTLASIYENVFTLIGNKQEDFAVFQKGLAVFQQGIDTGVAIGHAVVSASALPFPGNLLAIAEAVASVLALMASAKKFITPATPPTLETGGAVVLDGPSHAQGGLDIVDNKKKKVVAQGEGGELYVFSKNFVSKNPSLVDAIMDASNNNNGIIRRPLWLDESPKTINMPLVSRANRFEKFENGGRVVEFMSNRTGGSDTEAPEGQGVVNLTGNNQLLVAINKLNNNLENGISAYMVNSEFDKSRKEWETIKKKSKVS